MQRDLSVYVVHVCMLMVDTKTRVHYVTKILSKHGVNKFQREFVITDIFMYTF